MRALLFTFLVLVPYLAHCQYHSSSASAGVNFENISPSHAANSALTRDQSENRPRQRRMYAMCPPNFQRIGQECFTYPQQHSSWLEAHFFCKDKNARLAEPEKYADRKLREFLLKYDAESGSKDPIWIGATYDYINNIWQWSISGRNLTYNAFSKKYYEKHPNMDNQCAVYDPQLRYRWSSRTCVDKHRFICQHKMPKVSENNRHKVYHRWNATYPNQYANEVVLEVIDHRGRGRYNRRVIAEGSNEEMIVPVRPRNRQNSRRRPRPTSASLPHENDVNYHPETSAHPNDIQQYYTHTRIPSTTLMPALSTDSSDNEIPAPRDIFTPMPENIEKKARKRTMLDRKLQRQRDKELKRLQRKKERQEKMRREKEERIAKLRLEREQQKRRLKEEKQRQRAQQQQQQQQKQLEELREKQNNEAIERQESERQLQKDRQQIRQQEIENLRRQKEAEERKHLEDQEEERRRQAYLQNLKEQEEQERARKEAGQRLDKESQKEQEREKEERRLLEESKRKEYEEKLKQAENERARQLAQEQERKRLQDEENRRRLEEEEKQRQAELKRQLDEEEERLRLQRLEEERIAEERELARLREEQRKRAEIQRKREEEIARLEAEQKRIEEEEARIKEELEETERQAKLRHEAEIRRAEEEARAKEEERKLSEEQEERARQEKLRQVKIIEESRKHESNENASTNLKNRLASLPPELRKEFLEKRKQRKREKMLRDKMLKQAESTNNES